MTRSIGIDLSTGKNREHYRTLKETEADAGRTLSLLKLQILREAQKAVEHQRAAGKVVGDAGSPQEKGWPSKIVDARCIPSKNLMGAEDAQDNGSHAIQWTAVGHCGRQRKTAGGH
eukprot:gene14081-biopygen11298